MTPQGVVIVPGSSSTMSTDILVLTLLDKLITSPTGHFDSILKHSSIQSYQLGQYAPHKIDLGTICRIHFSPFRDSAHTLYL